RVVSEKLGALDDGQDADGDAIIRSGPEATQKAEAESGDALDPEITEDSQSIESRDDAADQRHDRDGLDLSGRLTRSAALATPAGPVVLIIGFVVIVITVAATAHAPGSARTPPAARRQ